MTPTKMVPYKNGATNEKMPRGYFSTFVLCNVETRLMTKKSKMEAFSLMTSQNLSSFTTSGK